MLFCGVECWNVSLLIIAVLGLFVVFKKSKYPDNKCYCYMVSYLCGCVIIIVYLSKVSSKNVYLYQTTRHYSMLFPYLFMHTKEKMIFIRAYFISDRRGTLILWIGFWRKQGQFKHCATFKQVNLYYEHIETVPGIDRRCTWIYIIFIA